MRYILWVVALLEVCDVTKYGRHLVGVSKNYVEWHCKVEQCINNKCVQNRRRCSVKYTRRSVTHKDSFARQNKTQLHHYHHHIC